MQGTYSYNVQGQQYNTNQQVAVPDNCNGVTFINRGDGFVTVNGIPLAPNPTPGLAGESIAFGGNVGELYFGRCTIAFAPGATVQNLVIVYKFYVNPNFA